ncbi:MAG: FeoB-associated Cys-rich membrane protein [Sphaerochaetaceae bacterium]
MNFASIAVLLAVIASLFLAIRKIRRKKKCGTCLSCQGCPMAGKCNKNKH